MLRRNVVAGHALALRDGTGSILSLPFLEISTMWSRWLALGLLLDGVRLVPLNEQLVEYRLQSWEYGWPQKPTSVACHI